MSKELHKIYADEENEVINDDTFIDIIDDYEHFKYIGEIICDIHFGLKSYYSFKKVFEQSVRYEDLREFYILSTSIRNLNTLISKYLNGTFRDYDEYNIYNAKLFAFYYRRNKKNLEGIEINYDSLSDISNINSSVYFFCNDIKVYKRLINRIIRLEYPEICYTAK